MTLRANLVQSPSIDSIPAYVPNTIPSQNTNSVNTYKLIIINPKFIDSVIQFTAGKNSGGEFNTIIKFLKITFGAGLTTMNRVANMRQYSPDNYDRYVRLYADQLSEPPWDPSQEVFYRIFSCAPFFNVSITYLLDIISKISSHAVGAVIPPPEDIPADDEGVICTDLSRGIVFLTQADSNGINASRGGAVSSLPYSKRTDPGRNSLHAYVFLMMKGDRYLKGVLVAAHSIRKQYQAGSNAGHAGLIPDIVCMITPDISDTAVEILREAKVRVVEVPYIENKALEMRGEKQKQIYSSWQNATTNVAFTKGNVLGLTEYSKVIFVDADMILVGDCDPLFSLHAPAATFSRKEAVPYSNANGIYNPYRDYMKHGDRIPWQVVEKSVRNGDFVMVAAMFMVEPSKELYDHYLELVHRQEVYGTGFKPSISGTDEVSICQLYCEEKADWTQIHQIYNYIDWHASGDWLFGTGYTKDDVKVYHLFGSTKAWEMKRGEYPDVKLWWELADEFLEQNPKIKEWWQEDSKKNNYPN